MKPHSRLHRRLRRHGQIGTIVRPASTALEPGISTVHSARLPEILVPVEIRAAEPQPQPEPVQIPTPAAAPQPDKTVQEEPDIDEKTWDRLQLIFDSHKSYQGDDQESPVERSEKAQRQVQKQDLDQKASLSSINAEKSKSPSESPISHLPMESTPKEKTTESEESNTIQASFANSQMMNPMPDVVTPGQLPPIPSPLPAVPETPGTPSAEPVTNRPALPPTSGPTPVPFPGTGNQPSTTALEPSQERILVETGEGSEQTGSTTTGGSIETGGAVSAGGNIQAGSNIQAGAGLEAGGNIQAGGNAITGAGMQSGGNTQISGDAIAGTNIDTDGNLSVSGDAQAGNNIHSVGNTSVSGSVDAGVNIETSGNLTSGENTTAGSMIQTSGSSNIEGNLDVGATMINMSDANVSGSVTAGTAMISSGETSIGGDAIAGGAILAMGDLNIGTAAQSSGVILSKGDMTISSTAAGNLLKAESLNIEGDASNSVTRAGDLSVGGSLAISGRATIAGSVNAGGSVIINGQTNVSPTEGGGTTGTVAPKRDESTLQTTPLQDAWPVQRRKYETPEYQPAQETTIEETPIRADEMKAVMQRITPSHRSESKIEVVTPRRPRPKQTERPVQKRPAEDATRKTTSPQQDEVPTEIGPLPADLWRLIGAEKPRKRPEDAPEHPADQKTIAHPVPKPSAASVPITPFVQREGAQAPDTEETPTSSAEEEGEVDINGLAKKVYAQLRRKLYIEAERQHWF